MPKAPKLRLRCIPLMCLALAFTAASDAKAKDCLGDGAVYRIDGAEGFELRFKKAAEPYAASDLEAVLVTPQRSLTFSMTASNGYSMNYLLPDEVKEGEEESFRLYGFDETLAAAELPQSGRPAPRYFFTPDLGLALWYAGGQRQYLPAEMWRLQPCGG
ncbi:MAG: hypothetical protein LCH46_14610 [Proteobacteria bacterium]|nr:hypothetical protein [Pseudomonadota bacterium]